MSADGNASAAWRRGLGILIALSLPLGGTAWAQAQENSDDKDEIGEIIVTGTRIVDPNTVATSPVQVVDAEAIKISGRNDVADILQLLPQNFNNTLGQDLGNRTSGLTTAGGVSTANLRGLGPNRTLVLVNGRRLGIGSPYTAIQSPAPNLDLIPTQLVERVDVVTGGASAVYGSDAIAGVINFVMKRNFEGLEIDGSYGTNWHDNDSGYMQQQARDFGVEPNTGTETDGRTRSFSVIGGANTADGRGNFTVYVGYQDQEGVPSGNRDFGACQLFKNTDENNVPLGDNFCDGSGNSNWFQPKSGPLGQDPTAVFSVLGNDFVEWGAFDTNPGAVYNTQPLITMSRNYERYSAALMGHYEINEHVKPYLDFSFMNDQSDTAIAPSGLFRDSNVLTLDGNYLVNCSNPLLSDQQRNLLCSAQEIADDAATPGSASASVRIGRRNVEGGARTTEYEHSTYRAVLGATGEITTAWNYDAYGQYYYVQFYNTNKQYLDLQKVANAFQVTTDGDGNPACISGSPCVPWNVFADGGVTADQLSYLYTDGTAYGTSQLGTLHFDTTGDLGEYGVQLPTATSGVQVNVGYEKRYEHQDFAPDSAELSGLLSGFGGASVSIDEGLGVNEWFAETRVPLIQERPWIEDLTFDAGYRYSDYSTSGGEDTYKFEVQYSPVIGARFRGSYNRAIRAPSIIELYNPVLVGQIGIGADPCAPTLDDNNNIVPAAASLQECLRTVRPDQAADFTAAYGNGGNTNTIPQGTASQLSQLQGGNTELVPETADTYTVGVTVTPELVPNFTGSLDYYRIELDDAIGTLPAGVILNGCPETGDTVYCSQLLRSPTTWGLTGATPQSGGYIIQTNQNIAQIELSGIDLQAAYQLELQDGWGALNFALAGTYMLEFKTTSYPGASTYDCAGLFGLTCQTVNPEWRHVARITWETPWDVTASLTWRYLDEVKQDNNQGDPTLQNSAYGGFDAFNDKISAQNYLDLAATYTPFDNIEIRAGINNLMDEDPPIVTSEIISGGAPNTYETYDIFGRQLFVGFTLKL